MADETADFGGDNIPRGGDEPRVPAWWTGQSRYNLGPDSSASGDGIDQYSYAAEDEMGSVIAPFDGDDSGPSWLASDSAPTASGRSGKKTPRHGKKKRTGLKVTLIILAVLLVLGGSGVAYAWWDLNHRLAPVEITGMLEGTRPPTHESTTSVKVPGDPYAGRAMNILVMGTDSREGDNASVSGDESEGMRSDTTFIMHVSADRTRVDLVSVPRDVIIAIPKCLTPEGKTIPEAGWMNMGFNAAFAYGAVHGGEQELASGAACAIKAVEAMSNVLIDAFIVVDFAGFAKIVDAIGGVDICLAKPVKSPAAGGLNLPAGMNHLDGVTATNYARARKGTGLGDGSDLQRIARQHELLQAMVGQVLSLNYFTDFPQLYGFVGAVADAVTTDLGTNVAQLAGFAYSLKTIDLSGLTFHMIPVAGATDGIHVVLVPSRDKPIWEALANDTPLPTDGTTVDTPTETPTPGADPSLDETTAPTSAPSTSATPPLCG